jgi:hypothetical protein
MLDDSKRSPFHSADETRPGGPFDFALEMSCVAARCGDACPLHSPATVIARRAQDARMTSLSPERFRLVGSLTTTLRPTELPIFGNPQGGTPFMECARTAGIDLPLEVLVWEDEAGQVWLGYNDPQFLARRHGIADGPAVPALTKAMAGTSGHVRRRVRLYGPSVRPHPGQRCGRNVSLAAVSQGFATCQTLLKPSPVLSPGFPSLTQV